MSLLPFILPEFLFVGCDVWFLFSFSQWDSM